MSEDLLAEGISFATDAEPEIERIATKRLVKEDPSGWDTLKTKRKELEDLDGKAAAEPDPAKRHALKLQARKLRADLRPLIKAWRGKTVALHQKIKKEIEAYYVQAHMGADSLTKGNRKITQRDVSAFQISRGMFSSSIFFYNDKDRKFTRVPPEELVQKAARSTLKAEEPTEIEREEEAIAAVSEEEEEAEDEDREEQAAPEVEHTEVIALRKAHKALIKKTVTLTDGTTREVPMPPLARYYHLMPPQALADSLHRVWSSSELKRDIEAALDRGELGVQIKTSLLPEINKFFDKLRIETCLIDREVNTLRKELLTTIAMINVHNPAESKQAVTAGMITLINRIISDEGLLLQGVELKRSNRSKLVDYVKMKDSSIVTSDELTSIYSSDADSGTIGISIDKIGKLGRAFEQFLPRALYVQETDEIRQALGKNDNRGDRSSSDLMSSMYDPQTQAAQAAQGVQAQGARSLEDDSDSFERAGMSGDAAEESMFGRLLGNQEKVAGSLSSAQDVLRVAVRVGETAYTLHNTVADKKRLLSIAAASKKPMSSVNRLMTEIKRIAKEISLHRQAVERLLDIRSASKKSIQTKESEEAVEKCQFLRDEIEYLSGLVEYFALCDVIGPDLRDVLLTRSTSMHNVALDVTDSIAQMRQILQKGLTTADIDAAITAKSSAAAESGLPDVEKKAIKVQINRLAEMKTSSENGFSRLSQSVFKQTAELQLDNLVKQCEIGLIPSRTNSGNFRDESASDNSKLSLALADTRKGRIKSLEDSQVRSGTPSALSRVEILTARERYDHEVAATIGRMSRENKLQMHSLTKLDTIRSLMVQYSMGSAAPELVAGSEFTASLPTRYTQAESKDKATYRVLTSSGKGSKVNLRVVRNNLSGTGEVVFSIPRDVVVMAIARDTKSQGKSDETIRQEFAEKLKYSIHEALRSISSFISTDPNSTTLDNESLIEQMSSVLLQSDRDLYNAKIRDGIKSLTASLEGTPLEVEGLASEPSLGKNKVQATLKMLSAASNLANMQFEFLTAVKSAFGIADEPVNRPNRKQEFNQIEAAASSEKEQATVISRMETPDLSNEITPILRSVIESLAICAVGEKTARQVESLYEKGAYEDRLVGLMIPVPAPGILHVGNVLTVQPPRRSMSSVERESVRSGVYGINAGTMISKSVLGILRSVVLATTAHALIPVMKMTAEILSEDFAKRVWSVAGSSIYTVMGNKTTIGMSESQRGTVERICEELILSIFIDPLVKGDDDMDTARKMLDAYRATSAVSSSSKIVYNKSGSEIDSRALETATANSVLKLRQALVDGACVEVRARETVKKLYQTAPCTAILLSPMDFVQKDKLLFDILTPPADQALGSMTSGLYNEIMGSGVSSGKTGITAEFALISKSADRLGAVFKVLNDFYIALELETNQAGGVPDAIINRIIRRHNLQGTSGPENLAKIAAALGVNGVPKNIKDLYPAAKAAFEKIKREINTISLSEIHPNSDSTEANPFFKIISEAVAARAGKDPRNICSSLGAVEEYDEYLDNVTEFIKSVDVISAKEADDVLQENPLETLNFGAPQLIQEVAGRVADSLMNKYKAESANLAKDAKS